MELNEAYKSLRRIHEEEGIMDSEKTKELSEPSRICPEANKGCEISQHPEAFEKFCTDYYNLCTQKVRDSYRKKSR